jgi:uncharacterized membrane-anchored protein
MARVSIDERLSAAVSGAARPGRRTKELTKAIEPGQIAVIDHADLDRVAAEGLVAAGVGAVINASASITGRYPNVGPLLLAAAGIPLLDGTGAQVLDRVVDGEIVVLDGNVLRNERGDILAEGVRQTMSSLDAQVEAAKATMSVELTRFAENTLSYMQAEQFLLLDSPDLPELRTTFRGRHALIVVRGDQFKEDLRALRAYIADMNPVIIAVDGGADAVLANGLKPSVIIGDFDSVSSGALRCGAELIVHAYPNGKAPGGERLKAEGVEFVTWAMAGTSEDIAMLLAFELGAELIVAVGTHVNLVDFLDKGRPGMASTFLVRLKVGPILVDAKGLNQLYEHRVRKRDITLLVLTAMVALVFVLALSPPFQLFWDSLWISVREWRR